MSDLRIPYRWIADRRMNGLSDAAFRSFVNSFAWSVEQRTDGVIHRDDIQLIPRLMPKHVDEFLQRELWRQLQPDVWLIVDYEGTQTTKAEFEVLERARAADREKKARQRAKKRTEGDMSPGTVPGTFGGTAQERQERQARTEATLSEARWNVTYPPETYTDPETGEVMEVI